MFGRLSLIAAFAQTIILAAAAPGNTLSARTGSSQCNTGPVQCCNSVQQASNPTVAALLNSVGLHAGSIAVPVGVTCSPITGLGASGTSCTQQSVCCENNSFNGLVAIGCTPINVNL